MRLEENRRNEIAYLIDLADASDNRQHYCLRFAGSVLEIGAELRRVERLRNEVEAALEKMHSSMQQVLGEKTPSKDELTVYIDHLSKEGKKIRPD